MRSNKGKAWLEVDDEVLLSMFNDDIDIGDIATELGRSVGGVLGRLKYHELIVDLGSAYFRVSADPYITFNEARELEKQLKEAENAQSQEDPG